MTGGQTPGHGPAGHVRFDAALLDEVVAAAWRAPEIEEVDGWQLRYGYGLTGRANSAWPRRHGEVSIDEKIAALESFYRRRGLRPKAQLSPASEPGRLDGELARRGWERSTDVLIETAAAPLQAHPDREVELADRPNDTWLDVWLSVRDFPRNRAELLLPMLLGGQGQGETVFASVGTVAVGRASAHDGWVSVTCMATLPEARGQGAGRDVLAALSGWARDRAARLCLNVDATNGPARRLYERAGFEPQYAYWYRTAPK